MEMIERVARAIADHLDHRKETDVDSFFGDTFSFDDLRDARIDANVDLFAVAIAAIEAMREPTEAMALANSDAGGPDDAQTIVDWQAMIDAALSEAE